MPVSSPTLIGRVGFGGVGPDGAGATTGAVEQAVADLRGGRMAVTCGRDGVGAQLVAAAEHVDAAAVNFMAREARGLVCLVLPQERCEALGLELIRDGGTPADATKRFTVSIEAREGVTTGISAADRARTIAVAIDPDSGPADIVVPGHVFPLVSAPGGLAERRGAAEAAIELVRAAGLRPAAVVCDIIDDGGAAMLRPVLDAYCERHGLRLVSMPRLLDRLR
jgi:3,4-dihydroxy 2-butanone 4-phosphate synthase/GTP cyclohydrolase II